MVALREELHAARLELQVLARSRAELEEAGRRTELDRGEGQEVAGIAVRRNTLVVIGMVSS